MFRQYQYYKLSRQEYEQARGTAHKQLLINAHQHLQSLYHENLNRRRNIEQEIRRLHEAQNQEKEKILVQHLVDTRLQEIKGIGPQRKTAILQNVFRGKLIDLQQAFKVPGITPQIQAEINRWAAHYQRELPQLLAEEFPGKSAIEANFGPKIILKNERLHAAEVEKSSLQVQIKRIDKELEWLRKITEHTFLQSLKKPDQPHPELHRYLRGVFAEWEPIPEWFQEVITSSKKHGPDLREPQQTITRTSVITAVVIISSICILAMYLASLSGSSSSINSTPTSDLIIRSIATSTKSPSATPRPTTTARVIATAQPEPTSSPSATPTVTATLLPTATAVSLPQVRVIIGAANLRAGPGQNEPVVGIAREGEVLTVMDMNETETWLLIQTIDGLEGWIGNTVVEPLDSSTN